jgi:ApaG protein
MANEIREFVGLRVNVDDVIYMPDLETPGGKPHSFVYFISIHNDSPFPVTLRGRKWVIHEQDGESAVFEGDGIVGQTPTLEPGGYFSYHSYHIVTGSARVSGAFFGETAPGDWIFTRIPEFSLVVPDDA